MRPAWRMARSRLPLFNYCGAPPPAKEEAEKLTKKLAGELQTDQLIAFVDGLKSKFGVTLNESLLKRFAGAGAPQ